MARKILNFLEGLLSTVTMIVLVAMGAYAGYALWDNQQIYSAAENVQSELLLFKEKAEEESVGAMFNELRGINSDVRAWLTIDNTNIDYPVLYGETNHSYINKDVYGKFSLAGSIFADSRNDLEFWDNYTLVHGHHMANRQMFGDLDLFKNYQFYNENKTGTLILDDRSYDLLTFACLIVDASDRYIFKPERWQDDDIELLLEYTKENALHFDKETIERLIEEKEAAKEGGRHPQIISLATCSSESDSARTILLAEMIPAELAENGEEEP